MVGKIVVVTILVTICKAQTQLQYGNGQQCAAPPCNNNAQNQGPSIAQLNQPQNLQIRSSSPTPNKGIKASPQLKIVPGQGCNLQAIPISQYAGSNLQRNVPQPCGGDNSRQNVQVTPVSQVSSPAPLSACQPSPCGSPSVITSPVSSINIPPSCCTTIIDNSLSNSLANALQMMIANEFINSAINNNVINQDCLQIPVETIPGFDLAGLLQRLNANQCGQVTNQIVTMPSQYQTARSQSQTIPSQSQTATNQCQTSSQCQTTNECVTPTQDDWTKLLERLQENGQCGKSQTDWDKVRSFLNRQNQQAAAPCQSQPSNSQTQPGYNNNDIVEALAAYFGCDTSEVCSNSYPSVGEIYFPEEIPAQLICSYGYMPTTVPVVSFGVQPVNMGDGNSFVIGC